MVIQGLRQRLEREKGRFAQVQNDISQAQSSLSILQIQTVDIEQAAIVIRLVAQQTQEQLQYYISDMVSAAIEAIFPKDDYEFKLEFVQRRNRTEADLFLADSKGNRINIATGEAGGLILIISFALRAALWSLSKSSRPVFILDEPAHFIHSREMHSKFAELLQTISEQLKLQIIMVTGEDESPEMVLGANKIFRIKDGTVNSRW